MYSLSLHQTERACCLTTVQRGTIHQRSTHALERSGHNGTSATSLSFGPSTSKSQLALSVATFGPSSCDPSGSRQTENASLMIAMPMIHIAKFVVLCAN